MHVAAKTHLCMGKQQNLTVGRAQREVGSEDLHQLVRLQVIHATQARNHLLPLGLQAMHDILGKHFHDTHVLTHLLLQLLLTNIPCMHAEMISMHLCKALMVQCCHVHCSAAICCHVHCSSANILPGTARCSRALYIGAMCCDQAMTCKGDAAITGLDYVLDDVCTHVWSNRLAAVVHPFHLQDETNQAINQYNCHIYMCCVTLVTWGLTLLAVSLGLKVLHEVVFRNWAPRAFGNALQNSRWHTSLPACTSMLSIY